MTTKLSVGFIGLGLMGKPMALNLLKAGFKLTVYNRTKAKTADLKKAGAAVAGTIQELAANCDVIITMITAPSDVKAVLLGENGVISTAKKGTVVIDMSTIGTSAAGEIAERFKEQQLEFIDAPVTGSVPGAESGTLTIFIGGDKKTVNKIDPVLKAMGTTLHHMGPVGMGQAIKLVNNVLVAASAVSLSQSLVIAQALGLSAEDITRALSGTPTLSVYQNRKLPNMLEGNYPTAFSMANMHKDVRLAVEESTHSTGDLTLLKVIEELFRQGVQKGLGSKDNGSVHEVLKTI